MNKPIVFIDIDGVTLATLKFTVALYNAQYGTDINYEDFTSYNLETQTIVCRRTGKSISGMDILNKMQHEIESGYYTPPMQDFKPEYLDRLRTKYEVRFLTARPQKDYEATRVQLEMVGAKYDMLICYKEKHELIENLLDSGREVAGFIDDSPRQIENVARVLGIDKTHMRDRVYNRGFAIAEREDNYVKLTAPSRVYDFGQFVDILMED